MASFDSLAPTYDDDFTHSIIATHLRNRIHHRLLNLWESGARILELGCGTGEDAAFLASHGMHVTATDVSQSMLEITQRKTAHLDYVSIRHLDLTQLPPDDFISPFDGVLSNFGALNCLSDWKPLARWLSSRVTSGGTLAFAIMAPYCLWETLWHGLHLTFQTATRRWASTTMFTPDNQTTLSISYPTVKRITLDFAPYFRRVRVMPMGLLLPPSDVYPVVERYPRLLNWLIRADDRLADVSQLALFADHYWIELQRK